MLTKENSDLYIDAYLENINNIFNASYEKSFIKNVIEKENVFVLLENQKISQKIKNKLKLINNILE
jgi:hypothetical protein